MQWEVGFADEFEPEFDALPETVQDELLARAKVLEVFGPALGRPHADTPTRRQAGFPAREHEGVAVQRR